MRSGKLDEELRRLSELADVLAPGALVLFNESFASTNEREGSEIARQVVSALLERRIKVAFVTHLHDLARTMFARKLEGVVPPRRARCGRQAHVQARAGRAAHDQLRARPLPRRVRRRLTSRGLPCATAWPCQSCRASDR